MASTETPPTVAKRRSIAQLEAELAQARGELAERTTERDEALEQQTATTEVLQIINSSPGDLQPVLDAVLETAVRVCDGFQAVMWTIDGERLRVAGTYQMIPEFVELLRRVEHGEVPPPPPLLQIKQGARLVHIANVAETEAYRTGHPTMKVAVEKGRVRTLLWVALVKNNVAVGAFGIARREVRPFTDKQIALLQSFADQAVIAMENARLLGELQVRTRDLEESLEYQTATSEVLQVISRSTFDLQPVLDTLVETAARLCDADMALIYRREGDVYRLAANRGFPIAYEEFARQLSLSPGRASVTQRAALECCVSHVADITADPEYALPEASRLGGARTALGVPLLREGEPIGVFTLARQRVEPFTERQIELVRTFADQAVIAIENARLITETREALDQQTATAEVLGVINSSPGDLAPVFDAMLNHATHLCGADFGFFLSRQDGKYAFARGRGLCPEFAAYLLHMDQPGPMEANAAIAQGAGYIHIDDMKDDSAYGSGAPFRKALVDVGGGRTGLGIPLRKDGALLGTFNLVRYEVRPFSGKQIALVQNFAAQAVIAMENARLITETREALEQQTATSDVLKVISQSTFDLEPVLQTVVDTAMRLCGNSQGSIFRLGEDGLYRQAVGSGMEPEYQEIEARQEIRAGSATLVGRTAAAARPIQITDAWIDPDYAPKEDARVGQLRTMLGVPLLREGTPIGVICTARTIVQPFTEKEIELVASFADQAVIAIENARLLGELRQRTDDLSEALEYQTATADVLKVISRSTFDLQPVLDTLVETAVSLCEGQMAFIYRRDGNRYHLAASFGFTPEYHAFMVSQPQRAGPGTMVGRVATTGQPVHIIDAASDPDYTWTEARERGGYRTMLGVPLLREGEPIGLISIVRSVVKPFSDAQIELMTAFADQAGIAIENARLIGELRGARDAAERALDQLKTAQASLVQAEKMASLGQLTAGIAHEIKNPLNFVNNFASLSVELLDELKAVAALGDDKRVEVDETMVMLTGNLEKIAEHGKRADNIVKSMLEHSRGVSGERREVDLNGVIEEALNLAYHGARAQDQTFNVTLERNYAEALKPIELAPQEMTRVFLNLFGNGFYAANKRARDNGDGSFRPVLTVATREDGDAVEVRVRDNGTGIPPGIRDKLFQPFFTTKPTGEGTGLGLSISYDIVTQQHGGTITVESEPGAYTEFTVRLPRH